MSNEIHTYKHNGNTMQTGNTAAGERGKAEQERIAQGVNSGKLTAGEASHLEQQQQNIQRQYGADKKADGGGSLTQAQKQQLNHEQNQASRNIANKKNNQKSR